MIIKTNPDADYVKLIRGKLRESQGYCPCRLERTPETKCMCSEFREQMARGEEGECHCGLYIFCKE